MSKGPSAPELPLGEEGPAVIEGSLEHVIYQNDETGFSVVEVRPSGERTVLTAVGLLAGVQVGEDVRLVGRFIHDKRYGRQLKVESFLALKPSTLIGIERYLGSGLVPGIGPAMAKRMVERFGLETLEVIERKGHRLKEVEGIGPVRAQRIVAAWAEQRGLREVMVFLQSHGVSTAHALRIVKRYGAKAMQVVRANPYQLATEVFGIGFKSADQIAAGLGFDRRSPRRAEAGVLFALGELADQGHVYAERAALVERARALLDIEAPIIEAALEACARDGAAVLEQLGEVQAVYRRVLYTAEVGAAERAALLCRTGGSRAAPPADLERVLERFEAQRGLVLAPAQRSAVIDTVESRLAVITGGPGTGKTTIVRALLALFAHQKKRVLLGAPTGRAAKRMQEATGQEARTLHRLLEFAPESGAFTKNADDPLEAEVVIVDEASMIDLPLFHHLLQAVPAEAQLVLVGDIDQLPSVGPGSVLADVIRSGVASVSVLDQIFRQAERSLIVVNAHHIRKGELPQLASGSGEELPDFYVLDRPDPEQALATLRELVSARIPRRFGMDPVQDIQVLTPMHKGSLGGQALNRELQALLNPQGDALQRGEQLLRVGDKVMQLRNNYELGVFNGDLGRISALDLEEREVVVRYDEREVRYAAADLEELALAYACSIHKSQGSEYPAVIVVLGEQHWVMLERNLIYTAVTRGKRLVMVLAHPRALRRAIEHRRDHRRASHLAERMRDLVSLS